MGVRQTTKDNLISLIARCLLPMSKSSLSTSGNNSSKLRIFISHPSKRSQMGEDSMSDEITNSELDEKYATWKFIINMMLKTQKDTENWKENICVSRDDYG